MKIITVGQLMELYKVNHPEEYAENIDLIEEMKDWIISSEKEGEIRIDPPGE